MSNHTLTDPQVAVLAPEKTPKSALVLIHGRGASAENILSLTNHLDMPETTLVVAPQAPGHTWYPERFIVPKAENEPELSEALSRLKTLLADLVEHYGIAPEQVTLAGFSQGACLVAEFLKQNPQRYQAAAIMSGGLIGSDEEAESAIEGTLAGTPVYLGCDQVDFHIPLERVETTAAYLTEHGGHTEKHIYEDLGHAIHPDALEFLARTL